jgi:hypothetical protein
VSLLLRRQSAPATAIEEATPKYPLVLQDIAQSITVGQEEFVSVATLSEDTFTYPPAFEICWCWPLPSPSSEDFAGSLPFEEPARFTLTIIEPSSRVLVADEDFGGAHPIEDSPPLIVFVVEPTRAVFATPEDFAGSLPLEEDVPRQSLSEPPVCSTLAVSSEEFASSLPLEEYGTRIVFIEKPRLPLTPPSEDFAGSLPFEDFSPAILIVSDTTRVYLLRGVLVANEDFAGSLPLEEDALLIRTIVAEPWLPPFATDEELTSPHINEEPPPFLLLLLDVLPPPIFVFDTSEVIPRPPVPLPLSLPPVVKPFGGDTSIGGAPALRTGITASFGYKYASICDVAEIAAWPTTATLASVFPGNAPKSIVVVPCALATATQRCRLTSRS